MRNKFEIKFCTDRTIFEVHLGNFQRYRKINYVLCFPRKPCPVILFGFVFQWGIYFYFENNARTEKPSVCATQL